MRAKEREETLDTTFTALGNGVRRAIVSELARGEATLSELAEPFDMTQTAVTWHVQILSDAGLVTVQKRGRTRYCKLKPKRMKQALDWLQVYQTFWGETFESFGDHVAKDK